MAQPAILVAHDLKQGGGAAFAAGLAMAQDLGARLILVHGFRPRYLSQADVIHVSYAELWNVEGMVELGDAHELTDTWANEARRAGVDVDTVVGEGEPAKLILETAEQLEALMIVLGHGGRVGLRHLLPGSTAAKVIRHSRRPILIAAGLGESTQRGEARKRPGAPVGTMAPSRKRITQPDR